jgi:hypothetical protein
MDPVSERLQGHADQVLALARQMIAERRVLGYTLTLAHVLSDNEVNVVIDGGDIRLPTAKQ